MIEDRGRRPEAGIVLLAVLLVMLAVAGASVLFISFMNQEQTQGGLRYRSTAARLLAEAGVYQALAILEGEAPDGSSGRHWRPAIHSEDVGTGPAHGRFTITLADDVEDSVVVTSIGEVGGTRRGLRVWVRLASPALLAALYGRSYVRLDGPPASTVIMPYGNEPQRRPWVHIAAGEGIWFGNTSVAVNKPGVRVPIGLGPTGPPFSEAAAARVAPARLLLTTAGELIVDRDGQSTGTQALRAMGVNLDGSETRTSGFPVAPEVDRSFYRAKAAGNTANAAFNRAAGDSLLDTELRLKRDSLYTSSQFAKLQWFADTTHRPLRLHGLVHVTGTVTLQDRAQLSIIDGALIVEGSVRLGQRSLLEVIHSHSTRMLPGLIAVDNGGVFVGTEAQLRVHGVVYMDWLFEMALGARVEVVGSVLNTNESLGFWNAGATVVIHYDQAVLGTPALSTPPNLPVVAWITAWQELP